MAQKCGQQGWEDNGVFTPVMLTGFDC